MKDRHTKGGSAGGVLTGALAGMAVGAAAVVLSKKQNRKKLSNKVNEFLEMGEERIDNAKDTVSGAGQKARKQIAGQMQKVTDRLQDERTAPRK